jgi:myo-inositol catabolism protein IolC
MAVREGRKEPIMRVEKSRTRRDLPDDLFLLPFDHRASFERELFGIDGREPTLGETVEISAYKSMIYDGFKRAVGMGVPKESAGILVDEYFGSEILKDAKLNGYWTACSVEKSGQKEFEFEYGTYFRDHIFSVDPDFVKTLVRYNPEGDPASNGRQKARLRILSDFCQANDFRFMFELLVPATSSDLTRFDQSTRRYDRELRPSLMTRALKELQDYGIEPDLWKVEGLYSVAECADLVRQARADGRDSVDLIVLGRAEVQSVLEVWFRTAAQVPGYRGFAVGRSIWEDSLKKYAAGGISAVETSNSIAIEYRRFCDLWIRSKIDRVPTPDQRNYSAEPEIRST